MILSEIYRVGQFILAGLAFDRASYFKLSMVYKHMSENALFF